jgi:DNA recombination protein RmuC
MNVITVIFLSLIILAAIFYFVLSALSRRIEKNLVAKIEDSFGRVALEALDKNSRQFLAAAGEKLSRESDLNARELTAKKELIDGVLRQMKAEMERVQNLIVSYEKDREEKFGSLAKELSLHSLQTEKLHEMTGKLNLILSDTRQRGLWGQRMAEDILRLVGLEEGINYVQQKTLDAGSKRPDFTFKLPNDKIINMDVKFPLDNFKKYLEEPNEAIGQNYKAQFFKDARNMIKQVITRDYINPECGTLDYVIVFIPLEKAYSFIMENDPKFMDDALRSKAIVCSPWTLYALLSVIRQSIDNFNLEKSANKILDLMSQFHKQWSSFIGGMEKMGKKIEELQNEYNSVLTTRRNMLEKPLAQIERLSSLRSGADSNGASAPQDGKNGRPSGGPSHAQ